LEAFGIHVNTIPEPVGPAWADRPFRSPVELPGMMLGWIGFAVFIFSLQALVGEGFSSYGQAGVAFPVGLVLTTPTLLILRQGHFGFERWGVPTPTGWVYLVWNMGLMPSLIAAEPPEASFYVYSWSAIWFGRVMMLAWFLVFAVAVGPARRSRTITLITKPDAFTDVAFAVIWTIFALVILAVPEPQMLSSWGVGDSMSAISGQKESAAMVVYSNLVGVVPFVSVFYVIRNQGARRRMGWFFLAASLGMLVIYSNRRTMIFLAALVMLLMKTYGIRISVRKVALVGVMSFLALGPLLWPVRLLVRNPDLIRTLDNPLDLVVQVAKAAALDTEVRKAASVAMAENIKEGRFDYAGSYLGTVQWVMDHGPRWGGTVWFGFVKIVPSFMWSEKNEIGDQLYIKTQLREAGIATDADPIISAPQEWIFQFGLLGMIGGAIFFGLISRGVDYAVAKALTNLPGLLLFSGLFLFVVGFETYVGFLIPSLREIVVIALLLWGLQRIAFPVRVQTER